MSNTGVSIRILSASPGLEFIDYLPDATGRSYLDELKADGAGSFRIPLNSPRLVESPDVLNPRNVVQVLVNGKVRGAWLLRNFHRVLVGKGESAALYWEYSGPGLRDWLHDAVVYPEGSQPMDKKKAGTRYFNFSSKAGSWYHSADWVAPVSMSLQGDQTLWDGTAGNPWRYAPVGWPDAPLARWIWDRDSRASAPVGDVFFRRTFTTTTDTSLAVFATADDNFQAFVDGTPVLSVRETNGWTRLYRGDIDVPAGDHVLAIKATNSAGAAGVLAAMYSYSDPKASQPAALLAYTGDSGWLCNAYPTDAPGWTPGEILRVLVDEAKVRGVSSLLPVTLGFTDETDSNGDPWETVLDWAFDIGSEYLDVVEHLEELAVEVSFDPETFSLNAYNAKGVDLSAQVGTRQSVEFRRGHNVASASEDSEASLKNVYLLNYGDGALTEVVDPYQTVPTYGRIEGFVTTDSSMTKGKSQTVATKMLELTKAPQESAALVITDVEDHTPWENFSVGDWVLGPGMTGSRRRRVVSISVSADEDTGRPLYEVELDTISQDAAIRINKFLLRMPQFQSLGETVSAGPSVGGGGGSSSYYGGDSSYDYTSGTPYYGGDMSDSTYSSGGGGGGGGVSVLVQAEEPTGVPTGTLWYDIDAVY